MKKSFYIPPYLPHIIISASTLVISILAIQRGIKPAISRPIVLLIASIYVLLRSSFSYLICPRGIVVFFLFIPVRLIRWNKVSTAEYLYHWIIIKSIYEVNGHGLMITLPASEPFAPEIDSVQLFTEKHPFSSIFMRFSKRNKDRYLKIFQEYFPNLTFQIGHTHLDDDNH